ncbi:cral trio domain-containing protein, partial [Cystoisospora suis]
LSWGGGGASASGEAKKDEDRTGTSGVRTLQWEEVLWLDDDLLLSRYLRSYNWNEDEARKQLLKTLAWRRERKPQNVSPYDVMKIAEKGSIYRKGFDRHGRAIIYFKPGRDAGTSSKASQEHILYTVERALQSVKRCKGKDQLVFLLDFNGWGLSQLPTTEVSREIVTILNYHYTDVLAHAFIIDAPSFFDAVWRLVCLMVDPETAKKVVFLNSRKPEDLKRLREVVPEEYIERSIGGGGGGGERENEEKEKKEEQEDSSSEEEESDEEEEEEEEADEKDDYSHEKYWRAEKS